MWANSNTVMAHASVQQKNTYSTFTYTNLGNIDTINTGTFFDTYDQTKKTWSQGKIKNIARGTTEPEIDSVTWTRFSDHKAWSPDVANLATRWRHLHQLQIFPPG